jgi:hypothetical protein
MPINVSELMTDLDFVQSYTLLRSTGAFVSGRWVENEIQKISRVGIISIMSSRELSFMPEGDRVSAAIVIHDKEKIFLTRAEDEVEGAGISDKILWRGEQYKIFKVDTYADYGYYKAIAEKLSGN